MAAEQRAGPINVPADGQRCCCSPRRDEPSSIVLIMAPILFPVAMKLRIDPVHFGIMIVVSYGDRACHPPVGKTSMWRAASPR
jgi:hypothetical protein